MLGYGLWTRRFGGEPDVVGREITLDGRARTVIGVMPPAFEFPTGAREVWTPLVLAEASRNDRRNHSVMTVARLRPGVTLPQARARMEALGVRLAEIHPRTNAGRGVEVVELRHQQRGVTGPFLVLGQLAAVLVLLIACANVSNLQLGRVTSRGREMTIRAALGAGRWRLGRLVVIESLLLALAGGGVGMGVAAWGVAVLRDSISPEMSRGSGLPGRRRRLAGACVLAGGGGPLATAGIVAVVDDMKYQGLAALRAGSISSRGRGCPPACRTSWCGPPAIRWPWPRRFATSSGR